MTDDKDTKEKKKYKQIPSGIRNLVWNKYISNTMKKSKCYCCREEAITFANFHCGHYISRKNGGNDTIKNLRPICMSCNLSMGSTNMDDYIKEYGLHDTDLNDEKKDIQITLKTIETDKLNFEKICEKYIYFKYDGLKIIFNRQNGYFNATQICKYETKNYKNKSKDISEDLELDINELVTIMIKGNNRKMYGTYMHYKFMKPLLNWVKGNTQKKLENIKWTQVMETVIDI
jgi:hypothetical protein